MELFDVFGALRIVNTRKNEKTKKKGLVTTFSR